MAIKKIATAITGTALVSGSPASANNEIAIPIASAVKSLAKGTIFRFYSKNLIISRLNSSADSCFRFHSN